jgi:hypothetical protein
MRVPAKLSICTNRHGYTAEFYWLVCQPLNLIEGIYRPFDIHPQREYLAGCSLVVLVL